MNDDIFKLIVQGREQTERKLQAKEAKLEIEEQEAQESWAAYTELLRKRLPVILAPYMRPLTASDSDFPLIKAPEKINGYQYVQLEIPELAPIIARIEAGAALYYQLPGIGGSDEPRYQYGNYASEYYHEDQLPVLLFDAMQLIEEFDEKTSQYERHCAEIAARSTQKEADPEYVAIDVGQEISSDRVLINALKSMVREIVNEALNDR